MSKFRKAAVGLAVLLGVLGAAAGSTAAAQSAPPHVVIHVSHPNDWWL